MHFLVFSPQTQRRPFSAIFSTLWRKNMTLWQCKKLSMFRTKSNYLCISSFFLPSEYHMQYNILLVKALCARCLPSGTYTQSLSEKTVLSTEVQARHLVAICLLLKRYSPLLFWQTTRDKDEGTLKIPFCVKEDALLWGLLNKQKFEVFLRNSCYKMDYPDK